MSPALLRVEGWPVNHERVERVCRTEGLKVPRKQPRRRRLWLKDGSCVRTLFIEPGSPWENGYIESFNGKLRDELLSLEVFSSLHEARVLVEAWRREHNGVRPCSSLGYRPPAPEAVMPRPSGLASYLQKWYRTWGQVSTGGPRSYAMSDTPTCLR